MQSDGTSRHKKGLDAQDIASAYGLEPSSVRNAYKELERYGKLKGTPPPLTLRRENGQQTAHYRPQTLYVLLPAVAAQAQKRYEVANNV